MRYENPIPFVYLNVPSHVYNIESRGESIQETAGRLIQSVDPERLAYPGRYPFPERLRDAYTPVSMSSPDGDYVIRIYERQ